MSGDAILAGSVADMLRRDILLGNLPPGSPLKERDHAERLGISRTPLREAVRVLAQEGLVTLRPLRSPGVADPGLDEVRDELALLRILELGSCDLACRHANAGDLDRIDALAGQVAHDYAAGDKVDVFDLDMALHRAIVAAGHSAALDRAYRAQLARLWHIRFLSARRRDEGARVLADHAAMAAALRARDAAALRCAMTAHLDAMTLNIERHFASAHHGVPPLSAPPDPRAHLPLASRLPFGQADGDTPAKDGS